MSHEDAAVFLLEYYFEKVKKTCEDGTSREDGTCKRLSANHRIMEHDSSPYRAGWISTLGVRASFDLVFARLATKAAGCLLLCTISNHLVRATMRNVVEIVAATASRRAGM